MRVLRAAAAEARVEAPGVIRRVLVPQFGAEPFLGVGPLRAVHLLDLDAGAMLPARPLANLSVLRLCWARSGSGVWLLRQDCGAGAELPAFGAPTAVSGVELWVQSRRSNGLPRRHVEALQDLAGEVLAAPGDAGWDASVVVDVFGAGGPVAGPASAWWQLLRGHAHLDATSIGAGDAIAEPAGVSLRLDPGARVLRLQGG